MAILFHLGRDRRSRLAKRDHHTKAVPDLDEGSANRTGGQARPFGAALRRPTTLGTAVEIAADVTSGGDRGLCANGDRGQARPFSATPQHTTPAAEALFPPARWPSGEARLRR